MISNYSRIKEFRLCKRKDYFSRVKRWTSSTPRLELDYGTAIHTAIPTWFQTKSVDKACAAFDESFNKYLENPYLLPEQQDEGLAMQRLGHLSIQSYCETWKEDFTLIFPEYQSKAPLLDGKHELAFRTDAVISVGGALWLLERKTLSKSISVNTIIESFAIDEQPTAYIIGLRKKTGLPITGFILEIVRKTTIPEIIREAIVRSAEQLYDTELGLYETIDEMEQRDKELEHKKAVMTIGDENEEVVTKRLYPKTTGTASCYQFFRPCLFLQHCKSARLTPFGNELVQKEDDYVDVYTKEVTDGQARGGSE